LDETRTSGSNLLPQNPIKRAQARAIAEIINSGIQPYQNLNVLKRITKEKKYEWLGFYLSKGLRSLETTLKVTSGKFCVGDEISIADLCLVPQIFHVKRNKIEFSDKLYPHLTRINNELENLPEFK
jgi:maleylacetoacetate isomerase